MYSREVKAIDIQQKAQSDLKKLKRLFPEPYLFLNHTKGYELLLAVILSAQCTDDMVNRVTPTLFKTYPTLESLVAAKRKEVERIIFPTGFYRTKAKHIQEAAAHLLSRYGGVVPKTMSELVSIPGVGRKTANVVLSGLFGIHEGIAVDTHVKRIARVLGYTTSSDPLRVERDLMHIFPNEEWGNLTYYLIQYGRTYCVARKHAHENCPLSIQR
jgi:endonuclease III